MLQEFLVVLFIVWTLLDNGNGKITLLLIFDTVTLTQTGYLHMNAHTLNKTSILQSRAFERISVGGFAEEDLILSF